MPIRTIADAWLAAVIVDRFDKLAAKHCMALLAWHCSQTFYGS
ncbi:hypothetical protein [Rhodopirellula sp. MGV]|nr:hypothetical protein [Rhodopirellula sp. MGV]